MAENKWKVAAYVDDKASEAQKNALLTIFLTNSRNSLCKPEKANRVFSQRWKMQHGQRRKRRSKKIRVKNYQMLNARFWKHGRKVNG